MGLDELLEKIGERERKARSMFPALIAGYGTAISLSIGTLGFYDANCMMLAEKEIYIFQYYLLQLKAIVPSNAQENEKISAAKAKLDSILSILYVMSSSGRAAHYDPNMDVQALKEKQSQGCNYQLIHGARDSNNELCEAALAAGADVNFIYIHDNPLIHAVEKKNYPLAKKLLEKGAKVNAVSGASYSYPKIPLIVAAENNDLAMLKLLVDNGADVNQFIARYGTTLYRACYHDASLELIQFLLDRPGIDINIEVFGYNWLHTPLSAALWNMKRTHEPQKVQLLLKAGAIKKEEDFETAITCGIEAVRLLLNAGYSCTTDILKEAICSSTADVIDLLFSQQSVDAEVVAEVKSGLIEYYQYTELMFYVAIGDIAKVQHLLVSSPESIHLKNRQSANALMIAAELGRTEIARLLITAGAKVGDTDHMQKTPLMVAAESNHLAMMQLLIEQRADVNAEDYYGKTALIYAAKAGCTEAVRLLIEVGAKVGHCDHQYRSALNEAVSEGHTAIERLLRESFAPSPAPAPAPAPTTTTDFDRYQGLYQEERQNYLDTRLQRFLRAIYIGIPLADWLLKRAEKGFSIQKIEMSQSRYQEIITFRKSKTKELLGDQEKGKIQGKPKKQIKVNQDDSLLILMDSKQAKRWDNAVQCYDNSLLPAATQSRATFWRKPKPLSLEEIAESKRASIALMNGNRG